MTRDSRDRLQDCAGPDEQAQQQADDPEDGRAAVVQDEDRGAGDQEADERRDDDGLGADAVVEVARDDRRDARDDVRGDREQDHLARAEAERAGRDHGTEREDPGEPVAVHGAGEQEGQGRPPPAPQRRDVGEQPAVGRDDAEPGRSRGRGRDSGTSRSTGTANTANHTAASSTDSRMSRPSAPVTPNQPTSGSMNPTKRTTSRTMPPRYPAPHPMPLTRPRVDGGGDLGEHRVVVDVRRARRTRWRSRAARCRAAGSR